MWTRAGGRCAARACVASVKSDAVFSLAAMGCTRCALSQYTDHRALPVGEVGAKILLLGADLRATHPFNPGLGGHALPYGAPPNQMPPGGYFLDIWCKLRGQSPELFYSTFAVRCITPIADVRPLELPAHKIEGVATCVRHHLALDLERVQPQVVIGFGYLALATLALYLSRSLRYTWGSSADALPDEGLEIPAPSGWHTKTLLILKAPAILPHSMLDTEAMIALLDRAYDYATGHTAAHPLDALIRQPPSP